MFLIWLLIGIASSAGIADATMIWHWFGHHALITILMILFLA
jgi:hypothetical protein